MNYENIVYEVKEGIGFITINRPAKLNALNGQVIDELFNVIGEVRSDDEVKAIILTGSGQKAFVAGADIDEIKEILVKDGLDFCRRGQELNRNIEELGKPSIAAVNGLALGGGCELALSCTFRILSENARLGLPELGLGVIPGYGGTQRLSRIIGKSRALWAMLTGDMISAQEALQMGLANRVVKPEELINAATEIARTISQKAPLAVKMAMMAVNRGTETDLESGLFLEAALANILLGSQDRDEGIKAFLEKRKPSFTGR
ncbi:MAG TPA: enoyl-CoA hydratase-related protein [Syntrophales bacterium]|nr:enoyl-CoA hydratase-related protein [Syntrophales bacterium]